MSLADGQAVLRRQAQASEASETAVNAEEASTSGAAVSGEFGLLSSSLPFMLGGKAAKVNPSLRVANAWFGGVQINSMSLGSDIIILMSVLNLKLTS